MKWLWVLILTGIVLSACRKGTECDERAIYSYLSSSQKARLPYLGHEMLKFCSLQGDTLSFACEGPKQSFLKTQKVGEDINCAQDWYLERQAYNFRCLEDSTYAFQLSTRVLADQSYSLLDFFIKNAPAIRSEDYALTQPNLFRDSINLNGRVYKALALYFYSGEIAGKWVDSLGLAQIRIGKTDYLRLN
ncbi:MAG: hypothetical protein L6Q78_05470 [Bacteroidia bacterium]|nr:hypothetical protein [Bacteroidia bacterium]